MASDASMAPVSASVARLADATLGGIPPSELRRDILYLLPVLLRHVLGVLERG
jgi:hypothetical protein